MYEYARKVQLLLCLIVPALGEITKVGSNCSWPECLSLSCTRGCRRWDIVLLPSRHHQLLQHKIMTAACTWNWLWHDQETLIAIRVSESSLALYSPLIVFICYTLWPFLVCFRIRSLNNAHGKVRNKKYNILHFINTYPCLASQLISTLSPTHHNHMSACTHVLAYFYLLASAILRYIFLEQLQVILQAHPALEATSVRWLEDQIPTEEGKEPSSP